MKGSKRSFTLSYAIALTVTAGLLSSCSHWLTHAEDRDRARLYLQLAADQFRDKQYNESIQSAQEALKNDASMAEAYNHIALVYMETKRYEKAEESFKKALEIRPDYPEVLNNMGVLFNRQDKYQTAIGYFEKALAFDSYRSPENAHTNLGYAYYRLGNLNRAKSFHQKALDIVPEFCLAQKNMGDVYAKEKNFAKAADYFEKAVTNCPLYQESQYKLGLTLMKMGQKKVAKSQLEKLVQKHQSGPYVERSNEVLKYLQ